MKTKKCTRCKRELAIDEFQLKYDNPKKPDRRRGQCKDCKKRAPAAKRTGSKKVCNTCGVERPVKEFALHVGGRHTPGSTRAKCQHCDNARIRIRNRARTEAWKIQSGGKCTRCGYDRCPAALDFHHRDPATKVFQIAEKLAQCDPTSYHTRTAQMVRAEIAKCDLVCSNCHREIHSTSE